MIKSIISKSAIFVIVIGSFAIVPILLSNGTFTGSVIQPQTIYIGGWQWNYYTINLQQYITNIQNSLTIDYLNGIFPNPPSWPTFPSLDFTDVLNAVTTIGEILKTISKYILTIVNWIIYIENILLLFPLKLLVWPINLIASLVAIDTSNSTWLQIVRMIIEFDIPYIPLNY